MIITTTATSISSSSSKLHLGAGHHTSRGKLVLDDSPRLDRCIHDKDNGPSVRNLQIGSRFHGLIVVVAIAVIAVQIDNGLIQAPQSNEFLDFDLFGSQEMVGSRTRLFGRGGKNLSRE